jgi:UPF0176 protein
MSREMSAGKATDNTIEGDNRDGCYTVLALYEFVQVKFTEDQVQSLHNEIEAFLREHACRGTILLACEGINGTICYPAANNSSTADTDTSMQHSDVTGNDPVLSFFRSRFHNLRTRISFSPSPVFFRLKVRIKSEIVTLGDNEVDVTARVGTYVPPGPAWEALLDDPDCLVIDARNDYEVAIGTFEHAVNPQTTSFSQLPGWINQQVQEKQPKKIAMFCTGGIRCEKASSYCLQTLSDIPVYHLEGGILAYLDHYKESDSSNPPAFVGECYVFDQRVAVTYGLQASSEYTACGACRLPLSSTDRSSPDYQEGVTCPYCIKDPDRAARRQRYEARHDQLVRAEQKGVPHIHDAKEHKSITCKKRKELSKAQAC